MKKLITIIIMCFASYCFASKDKDGFYYVASDSNNNLQGVKYLGKLKKTNNNDDIYVIWEKTVPAINNKSGLKVKYTKFYFDMTINTSCFTEINLIYKDGREENFKYRCKDSISPLPIGSIGNTLENFLYNNYKNNKTIYN